MADPVVPSTTEPQAPAEPKNNSGSDDTTALRAELEKATMRANQLANEAKKRDEADAEKRRKELEDKEEYKALYDKADAELREIREKAERETRSKTLADASRDVLKDYPKEVQEIADTAGIGLTDDSEAARASLKAKLDSIKEKVKSPSTASPTNPYNPAAASPELSTLVTVDPEIGGSPMAYAAAKGDPRPALYYISGLAAIQEMKRQAGYKPRT